MSTQFGTVYHLWNFADQPGEILDRAAGEIGIDHLTIPVVTGPAAQFRPTAPGQPAEFNTEGGWHFPPRLEMYTGTSVRPRAARWFGKRDALERVCSFATRRKLALFFRIDVRGIPALLEHAPHLHSRNAWGDQNPRTGACVMNPDLRELVRHTIDDLRRYEPAGVQLVNWLPDVGPCGPRAAADNWRDWLDGLRDICFCPACRQASGADADPEQAADTVRSAATRLFSDKSAELRFGMTEDESAALREYCDARRRASSAWLTRLTGAQASNPDAVLGVGDVPSGGLRYFTVSSNESAAEHNDDETACGRELSVCDPTLKQADAMVRLVSQASQGMSLIDFGGLEAAPGCVVDWLRQAVRYTRRSDS